MKDDQDANSEDRVEAHLKRAWEAGTYEAARAELEAALVELGNVDPEHRRDLESIAWMDYATLAEHFGDFATAAAYNEKVLADDPDDLASHLALSSLSRRLGKPQDAAEYLRRAGALAEQSSKTGVVDMLAAMGYLPADEPARSERIEQAIRSHRAMLEEEKPRRSSKRFATLQYELGKLYSYRSQAQSGAERVRSLEEAINAYRMALGVYSAAKWPDDNRVLLQRLRDAEDQLSQATDAPS